MTPTSPRLKRKPPEQAGPVRNRMAPPPGAPQAAAEPAAQTAPPRDPITAAGAAVCGALENGVRTAYSVIDEYMRRGQETARSILNNDPKRRGAMNDDRGSTPGGFNASNPMAMFAEQWMTAMRMWSQAWPAFIPGAGQGFGPGFIPGAWQQAMQQVWMNPLMNPLMNPMTNPFTAPAGSAAAPAVSVKIAATRPVEVIAHIPAGLSSGLELHELIGEPLHAERSKTAAAAPIDAPTILREPGKVTVSVKVADQQPAGHYRGFIRKKADGSVAGDITVIVS